MAKPSGLKKKVLSIAGGIALLATVAPGLSAAQEPVEGPLPPPEPISGFLAGADVSRGRQVAAANCAACHSFGKNSSDKIGPDLAGIFNRPRASAPDFGAYSNALKRKGGKWTDEELAAWIYNPDAFAPGTTMVIEGIRKASDRAAVVKFLKTLSK